MEKVEDLGFLYCYNWPVPDNWRIFEDTGTAVDCERHGHCLHESTAVGLYICCQCGEYISKGGE